MLTIILCSCPRLPAHQTSHIRHTYVHAGVHKDSDGKSITDWLKPWPIPRTEKPASEAGHCESITTDRPPLVSSYLDKTNHLQDKKYE